MHGRDFVQEIGKERNPAQVVHDEKPGTQTIVEVVGIVGDIVGEARDLGFQPRMACEL